MNISMYAAIAIVASFAALYIRQVRADYALAVTLAAVIIILSGIVPRVVLLAEDMRGFADSMGVSEKYIMPVLKIIGISYLTQIASDICADAGEKSLSSHVETAGKIASAIISLPIVKDVFTLILSLLE
jgi:stage III sporulation protein AD